MRTQPTDDDYYEARAGKISTFIAQKANALTTMSARKKLKASLKKGESLDDVFLRLKLNQAGDKLLEKPQFLLWLNYADELASKTGKEVSAITTLTTQYGDISLAKLLQADSKVVKTKEIAVKLELSQMQRWLAGGNTADDIFKLLKLNRAGDDLLSSPLFNTWTKYMQLFNSETQSRRRRCTQH